MKINTSYSFILDSTNNAWVPLSAVSSGGIPEPIAPGALLLPTLAYNLGFDGTNWQKIRVANVFKNAEADTAGSVTLWDPAVGKRVRLMGFTISVCGAGAGATVLAIDLEAPIGTVIWTGLAFLADTTPTGDTQMGADFGQGRLLDVNATLSVTLSDNIVGGAVEICAWGTEE